MYSFAFYNGRFGKREEITIPLTDRSIFFGDAIYEVAVGCYDRIMWEDEHIKRLLSNCEKIGIHHKYTERYLSSLIREIAVKSLIPKYLLYIQISRGCSTRRHSAHESHINLLITIEPYEIERHPAPIKLITYEDKRYGYCNIKTINLLPSVLASTAAEQAGCDEAVFIKDGIVTECAKSNISIIKQGRLITHPLSTKILPGITRAHLISTCQALSIPCEEAEYSIDDLYSADEILVSSTTKLCRRATEINSLSVGGGATELSDRIYNSLYGEYNKCQ